MSEKYNMIYDEKENKHNPQAEYCPYCKAKTLKVSDDNGVFCCTLCGRKLVAEDEE